MGEIPWSILISILYRWVQYLGCGGDRSKGSRNGPSAIWPQLFGCSAVVLYIMWPDSLNLALWVRFNDRYWYQSFIDGSNIWHVDRTDSFGSRSGPSAIGPQLFGCSAVAWYAMFHDSLIWAPWVRLHGRYWYQTFIDGSNIWGVDRTDPWGPEMDHPPLGRSYLVVVPSYHMSCALII